MPKNNLLQIKKKEKEAFILRLFGFSILRSFFHYASCDIVCADCAKLVKLFFLSSLKTSEVRAFVSLIFLSDYISDTFDL